jgi:hypothetical protein
MSTEVYEGDELYVTRFAGPADEGPDRLRWQFTPNGARKDPLGYPYAVLDRVQLANLAAILEREAARG